jgi:hypothetical protein
MSYVGTITIIALGYIVASAVGAQLIKVILKKYEEDTGGNGLRGAGMVIGIVERVLVLSLVLVGEYAGITIVFAAKSIARFNDLKDRNIAEYYLIGTLLSITFATITGIIIRLVVGAGA